MYLRREWFKFSFDRKSLQISNLYPTFLNISYQNYKAAMIKAVVKQLQFLSLPAIWVVFSDAAQLAVDIGGEFISDTVND